VLSRARYGRTPGDLALSGERVSPGHQAQAANYSGGRRVCGDSEDAKVKDKAISLTSSPAVLPRRLRKPASHDSSDFAGHDLRD
jgi:hypothetical protein